MLKSDVKLEGVIINFHPEFFCIHKHQEEVACNGLLFNNIYDAPFVSIDEKTSNTFEICSQLLKISVSISLFASGFT